MMDIQWDDKYLVGHPRIDHEHQVFVDLIRAVSMAADWRGKFKEGQSTSGFGGDPDYALSA